MSKFEEIGVEKQYASTSIRQANFHYEKSCYLCSIHGRNIKCTHCHIEGAHAEVIKFFNNMSVNKTA